MRHGRYPFVVAFLAPPVVLYAIYVISPYLQAFYISLTRWSGFSPEVEWVGLANYRRLADDDEFWNALGNNLILLASLPVITIVLGLFFASMLNVAGRGGSSGVGGVTGSRVYRVIYFFPQVLSVAIVGVLWLYIFEPRGGLLNGLLRVTGLGSLGQAWLGDPRFAFWCVLGVMVWMNVGFYIVLFSAGMQSIPRDIYEAALLDGSSRFTTFWRITVPLLWDSIQVAWIYLAIIALDAFALVQIMLGNAGGPSRSGDVLGLSLYRTAFNSFNFGYASAMGVTLFLLTLTIAILAMRVTRRERVEF
ncbi:MAG TPA: sugar ABC transporter permease [Micromonosporaceae bacterium]|jgi:N-acetylglucosamine transport system permease protein|nr:sugar ABC transporter permease [Micromonosporaceae bacterium]